GQISSLFGGRVAEALIYGKSKVTTGASNDIQRATQLARNMVTKWGLSDRLGPMDYGDNEGGYMGPQAKPMSEKMAQIIDEEIRHVVDLNYQRAEQILKEHIDILHNMAHALLDWETLDKYQIDELMQGKIIAPPEPEVDDAEPLVSEIELGDGGGKSAKDSHLAAS
ncbi:MAG: ATP-dependent zinc metalloprotease FtsH, partial [Methylobacter sp.]